MPKLPTKYIHRGHIGAQVRYDHEECGDQRLRLYVLNEGGGRYKYICFNCNFKGRHYSDGILTPDETAEYAQKKQTKNLIVKKKELNLPWDFKPEVPDAGKVWLYKYGITDEEIERFGFGQYNGGERLFMPVYDSSNKLIYYQGRNIKKIDKENPKYLNVRASEARNVWMKINGRPNERLVFVEDILSCIKVGRVISAIALLGSYMPLELTEEIMNVEGQVYIWLDPDKRVEAFKYASQFRGLTGRIIKPIFTNKDPKDYNTNDIREVLR